MTVVLSGSLFCSSLLYSGLVLADQRRLFLSDEMNVLCLLTCAVCSFQMK